MSEVLCSEEIQPLVEKLVAAFPENLSEVDPTRIVYVRKDAKRARRPVEIASVGTPYNLLIPHKFIVTIQAAKYDKIDDNRKAIALFDELLRIKDFEDGKLGGYTVISNYETVIKFGPDWMEAEETTNIF